MCLGMFLLGFILYGTLCASCTWLAISFSMLGKFQTIISLKIFSYPLFFSSSSGNPIIQMLVHLILFQRSLRLFSVVFILFTLALQKLFPPFCLPAHWFVLLLIFSRVFLISVIVLFVSVCLLFNSYRSLLIDSCIFCILFLRFWSSLLSLFWTLFQVVCLFPLHFVFLVCSFICVVFLCLFIIIIFKNLLCLRSPFPRPQGCIRSSFWFLPS